MLRSSKKAWKQRGGVPQVKGEQAPPEQFEISSFKHKIPVILFTLFIHSQARLLGETEVNLG